ncbi:MAG TPA: amino acid adenylation domain-containing protein [Longimicrobiales bacterium]|nr:amino acid adenylation domain-containing protein [Longimicrobiales bacterium]
MPGFLIHHAVSHWADRTPDHPALLMEGSSLSYAELEVASNRLAHALLDRGLVPGDRVGIFMHKSLDLGVALYGILKAGGVFVPLDPFLPPARLELMIGDCGIRHLVASESVARTLEALPPAGRPLVYGMTPRDGLEAVPWEEVDTRAAHPPDLPLIDLDLGYIMYTSGSTGRPKGMMHTHGGSRAYARWGADHVGLRAEDRVASHAPLHFDLSIFDFFSTARAGAAVVLVPEGVTRFPASFTRTIEAEGISVVFTVPFTLIEMLERGAMDQRDLSSLRWILFGGEPFPPKHLRALMARLPAVRFTNVYGPAEAPSCTCYDVPELAEGDDAPIPIGTLSRNSRGRILDADGGDCPVGVPGELCVRSSTLTLGYWKRPELNARVFLERPSHGPRPEVWYRTGDLVSRGEDGLLHFHGRRDRMVKTRGHRVELDEVEAALATHPAVSEAAAFAVPDGQGSTVILATVTLRDGVGTEDGELMRHIRGHLPVYALPREVVVTSDLPRTTSGKVDRARLRDLHLDARGP